VKNIFSIKVQIGLILSIGTITSIQGMESMLHQTDKSISNTNATYIEPQSGNFIAIKSGLENSQNQSIFSNTFCGCTGVALYARLKDGSQRAAMTHYYHGKQDEHIATIESLSSQLIKETTPKEVVYIATVILHPKSFNFATQSYYEGPDSKLQVDQLQSTIQRVFGSYNASIKTELYQYGPDNVREELEIVLNANNPNESYCQTKATNHVKQLFLEEKPKV